MYCSSVFKAIMINTASHCIIGLLKYLNPKQMYILLDSF